MTDAPLLPGEPGFPPGFISSVTSLGGGTEPMTLAQFWESANSNTVDWLTTPPSPLLATNLRSAEDRAKSAEAEVARKQAELKKLLEEVDKLEQSNQNAVEEKARVEAKLKETVAAVEQLQRERDLSHLLPKVGQQAGSHLMATPEFRDQFSAGNRIFAYVLSADIRQSTDLMLNAVSAQAFAEFVSDLCQEMATTVLSQNGFFDKFTGDGILAVFPAFLSGEDAGYAALVTAHKCHEVFRKHYEKHRFSFNPQLLDVGLGIGIASGEVEFVRIRGELTVVGRPVVYACRFGGAPPQHTLVGNLAYKAISERYAASFSFEEDQISFKHKGSMRAYRPRFTGKEIETRKPTWQVAVDEATTSRRKKAKSSRRKGSQARKKKKG